MRTQLLFEVLIGCLTLASSLPAPARACSCLASTIVQADPFDGAENVPLNKGLLVSGVFVADSIVLEDDKGMPVDVTLYAGPSAGCPGTSADLVPKQPLAPNSKYTIRLASSYASESNSLASAGHDFGPTELSFTTGTELLPEEDLEPPSMAKASVVLRAPDLGGCASTNAIACVGVDQRKNVEIVARVGDRELLRYLVTVDDIELSFGLAEVPDCIEFRRRAATGKRSAPITLCNDQLGARYFRATDQQDFGYACNDGVFGATPPRSASDDDTPSVSAAGSGAAPRAEEPMPHAAKQAASGCSVSQDASALPSAPFVASMLFMTRLAARGRKRNRRAR